MDDLAVVEQRGQIVSPKRPTNLILFIYMSRSYIPGFRKLTPGNP